MAILKQSTAYTRIFLIVQTSDHISGLTGASPTVTISKAGAAFAAAGGTVTEVANGFYKIAFTTTDTNTLGDLAVHVTATSGDPTDFVDQVTANILGDTLPANVLQWGSTNISGPATAGIPDVNVKNINNVAAATPGASGGILISGSNSGTTTFGALTCTGSFTISDGLLVSRSTNNTSAITATGTGTGSGFVATSGAGATGDGVQMTAGSTNGNGLKLTHTGTGLDLNATTTNSLAVNATQIGTQTASASGTITFPNATLASTANITAGTITTVTNLTNAPTAGDFTATMKTSIGTAVAASAVASVTAAVTVSGTSPLTEAYPAQGAALTLASALYTLTQFLGQHSTAGTTWTIKKRDGSTTAKTYTLDSSTTPTALSETT